MAFTMLTSFIHFMRSKWKYYMNRELASPKHIPVFFTNSTETKCYVDGTVTKINSLESYGLINNCIYFSFDTVCAQEPIRVGNFVAAHAVRDEIYHGWKAISVSVYQTDWKCSTSSHVNQELCADLSVGTLLEGVVTECGTKFGMLDTKYRFDIHDCDIDFIPVIGDLIVARVGISKSKKRIISWKPKELKIVHGTLTSRELDCGIINDDIIFFISSCHCSSKVSCGQTVLAYVIESNQECFKWRAISLKTSNECKDGRNNTLKTLLRNEKDVEVSCNLNFGNIMVGCEDSREIVVKNHLERNLEIVACEIRNAQSFHISETKYPLFIESNSQTTLNMVAKPNHIGYHEGLLTLEFDEFFLHREITVNVTDPIQDLLAPSVSSELNVKKTANIYNNATVIIPGEKFFSLRPNFAGNMPQYNIPHYLWSAVQSKKEITSIAPVLISELSYDSYIKKFGCLLHLEEIQMCLDMNNFDLYEIVLQKRGEFLSLEVPGLAEGRPSLLLGDKVFLVAPNNVSNVAYEGYIHEVFQKEIYLKFNENFHATYDGETYNASFRFNRSGLKRLHQAIRHVYNSQYVLFPKNVKLQRPLVNILDKKRSTKYIDWRNKHLNNHQKLAVQQILEARSRSMPYVIFGPPGTGKTVTLVEAILQIFVTFKNCRILICTPSNSAADLIAHRLLNSDIIGKNELVRLNSYQRNTDNILEFIKPFCHDKGKLREVLSYPIIISTCSTAGSIYDQELNCDHFTHVFIDEAGQLMEPECMVPIGIVCYHRNANVIMAGDPQQLGPVIRSNIARQYGLEISYLERIMKNSLYQRDEQKFPSTNGYNPCLVTMLTESYRSHPSILTFPSQTFYFSQLKCGVPECERSSLCSWDALPTKGFPLIFHGVRGEEDRDQNSPSWFNSQEAVQTVKYLQKLYEVGLCAEDVGIITPYRKQVEKLHVLISAFSLPCCKVGSVEEFQGQERKAIIISTVRSNENYIDYDTIHSLGFLCSPKRFNVAITRAKELLLVIGNPFILSQDHHWNGFITFCNFNGGYTGCEFTLDK